MKQIPSATDTVVLFGEFQNFTPDELFDHFTVPELLTQWWPKDAIVGPGVGGSYTLCWPEQNWFLNGKYQTFDRGKNLKFTWNWDHAPDETLSVDIHFMPIEGGTRMAIYHGPFEDTEEGQAGRNGILEGWIHFGMRLAGLREGDDE